MNITWRLFGVAAIVVLLSASSYQASISISINETGRSAPEIINGITAIGISQGYRLGTFPGRGVSPKTVFEDDMTYRIYFVEDIGRTSFKVNVSKSTNTVGITFEEFGVQDFSQKGAERYQLLFESLRLFLGGNTVVETKKR